MLRAPLSDEEIATPASPFRQRRRCLRRARCLRHLRGLRCLQTLRLRSGTIRMLRARRWSFHQARMSIAFRAMPRATGSQEICHLLVIPAPRYHGDTMQSGCPSPLVVLAFSGLFSPVAPGAWFLLVRAHPLPCVDLCIFLVYAGWCRRPGRGENAGLCVFACFAMVGAAVPGGVEIRGSHSWHLMKICRVCCSAGLV